MQESGPNQHEQQALSSMLVGVADQIQLEQELMSRAAAQIAQQDEERDQALLAKLEKQRGDIQAKVRSLKAKLTDQRSLQARRNITEQIHGFMTSLKDLDEQLEGVRERIDTRARSTQAPDPGEDHKKLSVSEAEGLQLAGETERERLIRTGKITPFAPSGDGESTQPLDSRPVRTFFQTHEEDIDISGTKSEDEERKVHRKRSRSSVSGTAESDDDSFDGNETDDEKAGSEPDVDDETEHAPLSTRERARQHKEKHYGDDGNESNYWKRLSQWAARRHAQRLQLNSSTPPRISKDEILAEPFESSPQDPDAQFSNGFKLPGEIYSRLFEYQRVGVQWLWELHQQKAGGIIGDEMGTGKTIQTISFLTGLMYSGMLEGGVVIVCPATVMKQWVQECHRWWPPFRVAVLHSSGSAFNAAGIANTRSGDSDDEDETNESRLTRLIERIHKMGHILITTYESVRSYREFLVDKPWAYVILDEGHKIRNPDAEITIACKQFNVSLNCDLCAAHSCRLRIESFFLELPFKTTSQNSGHCLTLFSLGD